MGIIDYLWGVLAEGVVIGGLFWVLAYVTMESTSLAGALRAGLISEAVGNIPYLFEVSALSPPGILMAVIGLGVFIRVIVNVGELSFLRAAYGAMMTYFVLVAIVACAPVSLD